MWKPWRAKVAPSLLRFEGGLGNQILNAALYWKLNEFSQVVADLSYFDRPLETAREGDKGTVSHWGWELGRFGISAGDFRPLESGAKASLIPDNGRKLADAISALRDPTIRARFPVPRDLGNVLPDLDRSPYICFHIRRGDYLNVASHLVPDEAFTGIARQFSGLLGTAVVLSDSAIPQEVKDHLRRFYPSCHFLDDIDLFSAHRVMRQARVLVCSNSQFSLVGALLNDHGTVFLPQQWLGEQGETESVLRGKSRFMLVEN